MGRRKEVPKVGRTHLCIGDSHATSGIDNRRFDWLGQIIVDLRPDVIINIGDMADMESLCSYDKGKRGYEGRRYKKDIEVTLDAQARMLSPLRKLQARQRKSGNKIYRPEMHLTLGNHEERINRATDNEAMLDGTIGIEDLRYEANGWKVYPFLDECHVDGIAYSHYFPTGVMARPVGGVHPATTLLNKMHRSCTCGHSHLADFSVQRQGDEHIMGTVLGGYFEHEQTYQPKNVNAMFWKGLVVKRNVESGCYDPEFYSLNTIKKQYLR